jgi:hypothetical protein
MMNPATVSGSSPFPSLQLPPENKKARFDAAGFAWIENRLIQKFFTRRTATGPNQNAGTGLY